MSKTKAWLRVDGRKLKNNAISWFVYRKLQGESEETLLITWIDSYYGQYDYFRHVLLETIQNYGNTSVKIELEPD